MSAFRPLSIGHTQATNCIFLNSPSVQLRPVITQIDRRRYQDMLRMAIKHREILDHVKYPYCLWLIEKKEPNSCVGFASLRHGGTRSTYQATLWIKPDLRHLGYEQAALYLIHSQWPKQQWRQYQVAAEKAQKLNSNATFTKHGPNTETYAQAIENYRQQFGIPTDYSTRHGLACMTEPERLHFAGRDYVGRSLWLQHGARQAWILMQQAAMENGIVLEAVSGFRSIAYQANIVRRKLERSLSIDEILQVNTAPGYSEHHSGRALDITTPGRPPAEEIFETTPAFAWLQQHAPHFGFRMSYPRDNQHGVTYEPWHWYWIG